MSPSLAFVFFFFPTFLLFKHSKDCQRIMRQVQDSISAQKNADEVEQRARGSRTGWAATVIDYWFPAWNYRQSSCQLVRSDCDIEIICPRVRLYLLCKTVFPSQSGSGSLISREGSRERKKKKPLWQKCSCIIVIVTLLQVLTADFLSRSLTHPLMFQFQLILTPWRQNERNELPWIKWGHIAGNIWNNVKYTTQQDIQARFSFIDNFNATFQLLWNVLPFYLHLFPLSWSYILYLISYFYVYLVLSWDKVATQEYVCEGE